MESIRTPNGRDDSQFEREFCEKLYELQNNTDTLRTMQKELLETRHALYSTELLLEKERGFSHQLKMQLKTAMDTVNELRQQEVKNQVESIQLQVKCDAMIKQYDALMSQATSAKTREIEHKIKIQDLEENLRQKDMANSRLEQTLKELEYNNSRIISAIDRDIAKLKQEHQHLTKSCETIIDLNQRLQTIGLCTYAIHQKDKRKIKDLEYMLASMSLRNAESTSYNINSKIKELPTT